MKKFARFWKDKDKSEPHDLGGDVPSASPSGDQFTDIRHTEPVSPERRLSYIKHDSRRRSDRFSLRRRRLTRAEPPPRRAESFETLYEAPGSPARRTGTENGVVLTGAGSVESLASRSGRSVGAGPVWRGRASSHESLPQAMDGTPATGERPSSASKHSRFLPFRWSKRWSRADPGTEEPVSARSVNSLDEFLGSVLTAAVAEEPAAPPQRLQAERDPPVSPDESPDEGYRSTGRSTEELDPGPGATADCSTMRNVLAGSGSAEMESKTVRAAETTHQNRLSLTVQQAGTLGDGHPRDVGSNEARNRSNVLALLAQTRASGVTQDRSEEHDGASVDSGLVMNCGGMYRLVESSSSPDTSSPDSDTSSTVTLATVLPVGDAEPSRPAALSRCFLQSDIAESEPGQSNGNGRVTSASPLPRPAGSEHADLCHVAAHSSHPSSASLTAASASAACDNFICESDHAAEMSSAGPEPVSRSSCSRVFRPEHAPTPDFSDPAPPYRERDPLRGPPPPPYEARAPVPPSPPTTAPTASVRQRAAAFERGASGYQVSPRVGERLIPYWRGLGQGAVTVQRFRCSRSEWR